MFRLGKVCVTLQVYLCTHEHCEADPYVIKVLRESPDHTNTSHTRNDHSHSADKVKQYVKKAR